MLYVTLIRTNSVRKRFDSAEVLGDQAFPTDAIAVREARLIWVEGATKATMLSDQAPFKLAEHCRAGSASQRRSSSSAGPASDLAAARHLSIVEPLSIFFFNHSALATALRWGLQSPDRARPSPRPPELTLALTRRRHLFGLGLPEWIFLLRADHHRNTS